MTHIRTPTNPRFPKLAALIDEAVANYEAWDAEMESWGQVKRPTMRTLETICKKYNPTFEKAVRAFFEDGLTAFPDPYAPGGFRALNSWSQLDRGFGPRDKYCVWRGFCPNSTTGTNHFFVEMATLEADTVQTHVTGAGRPGEKSTAVLSGASISLLK